MRTVPRRPQPRDPAGSAGPRAPELGLVAGCLAALAVLATWPLAAHLTTALPSDLADPLLNTFTLAWGADRLRDGLRGFWDASYFYPTRDALALSEHLLGIAVFTAPVQWLTGNPVLAYNLAFLASYVLAGLGMYLLARSLWPSRPAAWIAALAFAFAPHRVMHVSHLQMLMSGWTPLALWGLHRYAATSSRRALAIFAAASALQALSCGYLMYYLLLPVGLALALELARRLVHRAPIGRLVAGLAVATGAVVFVLVPVAQAYLRIRSTFGFRRSIGEMTRFSATVADYWHIPGLPLWSGRLPAGALEHMLFPGLAVVALAVLGLMAGAWGVLRKQADTGRWTTATYTLVVVLAVWLSFGPSVPGPYRWLASYLPGFDGLRVPARFIVIVALGLAVLAGGGVAWMTARLRPALGAVLAAGLGLAIVAEGYGGPMPLAAFDAGQHDRRNLNAWLRAAPAGGLLELPVAGPGFEPFTLTYQYNTLLHGHPIVNGYSGSGYALQDFLAGRGTPLADDREIPAMLRGLRGLDVRYLVLHRSLYEQRHGVEAARALEQAIDDATGQIAAGARFPDAVAWRLAEADCPAPAPGAAGEPIPPDAVSLTASTAPDEARLAMDGTTETRWSSGRAQAGGEWFRLALPRETDVGALLLRTDRWGHTERPRRFVVESEDSAGSRRVLFDDSPLPQMMAEIARHGVLAPTAIHLPPNASRVLLLRQLGRGPLHWSIYELELRTR
ncbi:MAG TPA: hypothetical protein VK911_05160 [Vicinamibacterales bacterium]|nr:hypothetical protein [Vicinamibacterales bacterium]